MNAMPLHLDRVPRLAGFAVCNVPKGHCAWILTSSRLTSDEPDFYKYIEQISNTFLHRIEHPININAIHSFLILIHHDLSADIYINDFPIEVNIRAKRSVKTGTLITDNDIADMREVRFPSIDIQKSDQVICCFKVGWKFGLYFTLDEGERDIASMQVELGRLYRYLSFQYIYQTLESETYFTEMLNDGWFPFIEILGNEYKTLIDIYKNEKFDYGNRVKILLDRFDESRVKRITKKWWDIPIFHEKQTLLQAGIDSFLQGNESGYINCIKNLFTELEGIMRVLYFEDTGKGKRIEQKEFISHLIDIGKRTAGDDHSLLLPQPFLEYLTKCIFPNFNLETGTVELSRHTAAHGVATGRDYTPIKALQALLTLDQIYFYLPSPSNKIE